MVSLLNKLDKYSKAGRQDANSGMGIKKGPCMV